MIPYNKNLKELARQLRKEPTEAERCLWERLKGKHLGLTFYRQRPIGDYIVDFYCLKAGLVIEVDGGQHSLQEALEYDEVRRKYLENLGLKVLRFTNTEVLQLTDTVAKKIYNETKSSSYPPLKRGTKVGVVSDKEK